MFNPVSTYRLQFHKGFNAEDFRLIENYLISLGIKTVYASPLHQAVPGSMHGYDALDPLKPNPEVFAEPKWINKLVKADDLTLVMDIVPNHMAYDPRNPYLRDVLQWGTASPYASWFDIDWQRAPVMAPFLGCSLQEAIEKRELGLSLQGGEIVLSYFDAHWPLSAASYLDIFSNMGDDEVWTELGERLRKLLQEDDARNAWQQWLKEFESLIVRAELQQSVEAALSSINEDPSLLKQIADRQYFRLCYWKETNERINYRRFFTVNSLICLNIQYPQVLKAHHEMIADLVKSGLVSGLRNDHIDGLYDPGAYLNQLRKLAGKDCWIVTEKILEQHESLPDKWPVQGNTGYDFLALVSNLFTNRQAENEFTTFYHQWLGASVNIEDEKLKAKSNILFTNMNGELDNLCSLFSELQLADGLSEDELINVLRPAIAAMLIHMPVYRFYPDEMPLGDDEREALRNVLRSAATMPGVSIEGIKLLEDVLILQPATYRDMARRALHFFRRCMQYSGPLMAKGIEDTLMYTYQRFIAHNEVGDSPDAFGITVSEFHEAMQQRQQNWPLSLNGSATHDTKRGEDARARLLTLSYMPAEWFTAANEWKSMNASLKKDGMPFHNDEYFIYQTLVAVYDPQEGFSENFLARLDAYFEKALREGKQHSNWEHPNLEYEEAVKSFVHAILDYQHGFRNSFLDFIKRIADAGMINSLNMLILKVTCPGIPDIYQGTEGWDYSLVDPDNRRPVDYEKRRQWLEEIEKEEFEEDYYQQLWEQRHSGKIKCWLLQKLLGLRNLDPGLFSEGEYIPLEISGSYANEVIAFLRRKQGKYLLVVIPLNVTEENRNWKDTTVILPEFESIRWQNLFSSGNIPVEESLLLNEYFDEMPFIIWTGIAQSHRSAGVLLHISSLPSAFGIGDLGPEAYAFAKSLHHAGQSWWQVLPVNPAGKEQSYSPYSAFSAFAGNPLFISPELLVEDGLLDQEDCDALKQPLTNRVDYEIAETIKTELLQKAFENFEKQSGRLQESFQRFCSKNVYWLDGFALYITLRREFDGRPWYEWPEAHRLRDAAAINEFKSRRESEIRFESWKQFVFFRQWGRLKKLCSSLDVRLLGDLPIYLSHDSADVWEHREIFSLDVQGNRLTVAGVPPDAFSENGQLWGMPLYNWDHLRSTGYKWWIERLKWNAELFNLVRLDHFRGFQSYWEVPASAATAKEGRWVTGPGMDFFLAIKKAMGYLPFIAEDLGDISPDVYALRDHFNLPGMKVLQFAFGDDMSHSTHISHNHGNNFLVYTGTHDNNTTRGWWNEIDKRTQKNFEKYTGQKVKEKNVAELMMRMAYASPAATTIVPMQDILNLDEKSRMNRPATLEGNWGWRMKRRIKDDTIEDLREMTRLFGRG